MKVKLATIAVVALAVHIAPLADACQGPPVIPRDPPSQVPCSAFPESPVVSPTDPFSITFSFTNFPTTAPFPPPFFDDLEFQGSAFVNIDPATACPTQGPPAGEGTIDPSRFTVELDEAWSPFADEPTSHTQELIVTPTSAAEYFSVFLSVCAATDGGPGGCDRTCQVSLCVPTSDDPSQSAVPYAEFVEPNQAGDAGAELAYGLRVVRNGYTAGRTLTVKVERENRSDPLDLFPIEPSIATGAGFEVTGDDETLPLTCSLHYPCFAGIDNALHVTIHDGATLLWDSRTRLPRGLGRAGVDRSPLARLELVAIEDDGGDGALGTGEHGFIDLRLYARNPYFIADLENAALELPLPAGLTVVSHVLHHHDNPLDMYDPSPAELQASATVTTTTPVFRVDAPVIEARFPDPTFDPPPYVFRDLLEVELRLETPAGGFASPVDLDFPGVTVSATASGVAKLETSAPVVVSVTAARPPNRVAPLLLVKARPDEVRLVWDDPPTDPGHDAATSFRIHGSDLPDRAFGLVAEIPDTIAPTEEYRDPVLQSADSIYYLISAWNSHGSSGDDPR